MTRKQGIRAFIFIVILIGLVLTANHFLGMPQDDDVVLMTRRFEELYSDSPDQWDGVIIGTSVADRAWAAPLAYEEYGMAVYPMATDGQPFVLTENLLEEIRKYQDISFAAVELHGIRRASLRTNGGRIRWITDNMKWSANRFDAVTKALNYMDQWYPGRFDESSVSRLSYYIPFLKFHSRLTADQFYTGDFYTGTSEMKGVYEAERHVAATPIELNEYDTIRELTAQQTALLDELMEYAEEKQIRLVFFLTPSSFSEKVISDLNAAVQYVEDKGYPVLNFQKKAVWEEAGIEGTDDFIDEKHLNTKGARKFTEYFAVWLEEQLELPDHRGDQNYESWDTAAKTYQIFYEESLPQIEEWKLRNL